MSNRPPTAAARPATSQPRGFGGGRSPMMRQHSAAVGAQGARTGAQGGPPRTAAAGPKRPSTSMSMAAGEFHNWAESEGMESPSGVQPRPASRMAPRGGRVATAMAGAPRTAAARPGSRMGTSAGRSPLNVTERPVTQQGLAGVRPSTTRRGGARQVQDKSYFMGLLRAKITDLNTEIGRLSREVEHYDKERQNFMVYEQRAESMAKELKQLQGTLADYNMLVDKMTTNTDFSDVQHELRQVKEQNQIESQAVDTLFAERREREAEANQLELELEESKRYADNILNEMTEETRTKYEEVKEANHRLTEELQMKQQETDELGIKKSELEDELAVSQIKQEAMLLHEKLAEAEMKRDNILKELNAEGSPDQQRERLLEQVKKDNEEIAAMEKQSTECRERMDQCREELRELDDEFEDKQGEKNQKYRELRQKEVQIDDFLKNFDQSRLDENQRIDRLHAAILNLLALIGQNAVKIDKTISVTGMNTYDLQGGKKGGRNNVEELQEESVRLQEYLFELDEMQAKAEEELEQLKTKMDEMRKEIDDFGDIEQLRKQAEAKQESLMSEKNDLESQVQASLDRMQQIKNQVSQLQAQLNENDAHLQIVNLEKKLQYVEQNNFAVREVINARQAETNVEPVKEQGVSMLQEYNSLLSVQAGRMSNVMGTG